MRDHLVSGRTAIVGLQAGDDLLVGAQLGPLKLTVLLSARRVKVDVDALEAQVRVLHDLNESRSLARAGVGVDVCPRALHALVVLLRAHDAFRIIRLLTTVAIGYP